LQFKVVLTGGNSETLSLEKMLRIYINDVDYPIANHSFLGLQAEYSIFMEANQMLVGIHAVHSDVLIRDCPHHFYQARELSLPLV
jgi:hypothetical protein